MTALDTPPPDPKVAEPVPPVSPDQPLIYGSFWIDESEFALPVSAVREVVNEPEIYSPVPLAPALLKGLFNLRGMIIPMIDLRVLLEFPEGGDVQAMDTRRKVAIIENGDKCVGLLFDSTGEVLNESEASRVMFRNNEEGLKDVIIDGVLKLENGDRMVRILDPFELVGIERVPHAENAGYQTSQQKGDIGRRRSCVAFQLGHTYCAIDLRYVTEVKDMPPVDKSLLAHGSFIGTINLRGEIVPVVDFRSFMGNEEAYKLDAAALSTRKLLVMRSKGGLVGLMVFSIDNILSFFESDVLPFAKLALPRGNMVRGCLIHQDKNLVMLLDHDKLMADPVLVEPARTCQDLHKRVDDSQVEAKKSTKISERRTFILFSVATPFAMDTRLASEVIERPDNLLEPPYKLDYTEGVINLRGELITLINLRRLYRLEGEEKQDEKVLIFKHKSRKYAVLVDTVDGIVMTTADKVSDDAMTRGTSVDAGSKDVSGVLRVPQNNTEEDRMVMIMDVDALMERCANQLPDGQASNTLAS